MCEYVSMSQRICLAIELFRANITSMSSFLSFAFSFVAQQGIFPVSLIVPAITFQPILFITTALLMLKHTLPVFGLLVAFSKNFLLIHDLRSLNVSNLKNTVFSYFFCDDISKTFCWMFFFSNLMVWFKSFFAN